MLTRPARRPLSRRTTGSVWLAVALGSVVPDGLQVVPVLLVAAILVTWGRGRTLHLWCAALFCQGVALAQTVFDGPLSAWLVGVLLGGFPALSLALVLWMLADRERARGSAVTHPFVRAA